MLAYAPEEPASAARFAQALETEVAKPRKAPERDRAPAVEAPPPALPASPNKAEGPGRARILQSARALKPWLMVAATVVVALVLWGRARLLLASAPEQAQAPNEGTVVEGESATATTPSSESSPSQERQGSEDSPPTRCGGRRRVLAYVNEAQGVRTILEHLGLPTAGVRLAPAREPPQAAGC